jgi:hypothetical protein
MIELHMPVITYKSISKRSLKLSPKLDFGKNNKKKVCSNRSCKPLPKVPRRQKTTLFPRIYYIRVPVPPPIAHYGGRGPLPGCGGAKTVGPLGSSSRRWPGARIGSGLGSCNLPTGATTPVGGCNSSSPRRRSRRGVEARRTRVGATVGATARRT